jgi:hypothetical protein
MVVTGCIAVSAACSSNGRVGIDACPSSGFSDDYFMLSPTQSSVVTKLNGTTHDVEWTQQSLTARNVYFLTRSGGVEGIRPTLCRAGGSSADCVVLPPYVDSAGQEELVVHEIVARKGGTIYLRSGAHLLRLDFAA